MNDEPMLGGGALPAWMYRDPMEAAIRNEEQSCEGCAHSETMFGKKVCLKGKRHTSRCGLYKNKGGK